MYSSSYMLLALPLAGKRLDYAVNCVALLKSQKLHFEVKVMVRINGQDYGYLDLSDNQRLGLG